MTDTAEVAGVATQLPFNAEMWMRDLAYELGEPTLTSVETAWFANAIEGVIVDKAMTESVRIMGVVEPPILFMNENHEWSVLDGLRRIAAAKAAGIDVLNAMVFSAYQAKAGGRYALTIALNQLRSDNPIKEYEAIEELVATGLTYGQITEVTGMSGGTIKRRLRLRSLAPALMQAGREGKVGPGVLESASKLTVEEQTKLSEKVAAHEGKGKALTAADVSSGRKVDRNAAQARTLPDAVFAPTDDDPYGQVAGICDRLIRRLHDIPDEPVRTFMLGKIGEVQYLARDISNGVKPYVPMTAQHIPSPDMPEAWFHDGGIIHTGSGMPVTGSMAIEATRTPFELTEEEKAALDKPMPAAWWADSRMVGLGPNHVPEMVNTQSSTDPLTFAASLGTSDSKEEAIAEPTAVAEKPKRGRKPKQAAPAAGMEVGQP